LLRSAHLRKVALDERVLHLREKAESELQAAMQDAWDVQLQCQALQVAIASALDCGVNAELIEAAQQKKAALEEGIQTSERHAEVTRALESSIYLEDRALMSSVIRWAENVGLCSPVLDRAKELEDECREASLSLEAAMKIAEPDRLKSAIRCAERKGVADDLLVRARQQCVALDGEEWLHVPEEPSQNSQKSRDARRFLEEAMNGHDMSVLVEAINVAWRMGVRNELVEMAEGRRHSMDQDAQAAQRRRRREEAAAALESACTQADIPMLAAAIDKALQTGVSMKAVVKAKRLKASLEDMKRQALREEAESSLEVSLASAEDSAVLARAIERAAAAGVNMEVVETARERMLVLEEGSGARQVAECALQSSMSVTDPDVLGSAIAWASRTGVREEVLQKARWRKEALQRERVRPSAAPGAYADL